jgi:2-iminobutanoate/2-iminopropanoate deaminase
LKYQNTEDTHCDNQQGNQEPWYALGKRIWLCSDSESRLAIYISGQVSHDETSRIVGRGDMEAQMRQTYINIQKVLTQYGATMDNIVDEILFVTDMDAAFSAAVKCRKDVFSGIPVVASTIVQIQRLAFPELLIEIRCIARV